MCVFLTSAWSCAFRLCRTQQIAQCCTQPRTDRRADTGQYGSAQRRAGQRTTGSADADLARWPLDEQRNTHHTIDPIHRHLCIDHTVFKVIGQQGKPSPGAVQAGQQAQPLQVVSL